ncbi:hypothetical protein GN244_ATG18451 [Phytophthora infestans]|nr:hypothetical protein GN244_ATG18451 [Phytophthora infestans]KAF4128217.1 hypothetical protein GN958_ATG22594 [Phytophthora infestans]
MSERWLYLRPSDRSSKSKAELYLGTHDRLGLLSSESAQLDTSAHGADPGIATEPGTVLATDENE